MDKRKNSSKVTVYDVAREAGVSDATVSRVFNNKGNVRSSTRNRVLEAAESLGYVVNLQARSLAGGKSNIVGVLVPGLDNGYMTEIIHGVDQELADAGYEMMVYTTHRKGNDDSKYLQYIANGITDGVILIVPLLSANFLDKLKRLNYPYVLVDAVDPSGESFAVDAANWQGAYEATQYLIQLGHKRIGFITGLPETSSANDRLAGFQAALHDHDISVEPSLIVNGDFWQLSGYQAAIQLLGLAEAPTAIFASNDLMALGTMDAVRECGLEIPHDISVISFDDIPQASITYPKLTTVHQPLQEMGRIGVRLLVEQIRDPKRLPEHTTLPTRLIIRDSCQVVANTAPHTKRPSR